MISYSDYVLSQRPWGYWPLNDLGLPQYNENQTIIDCSGNQNHLLGLLNANIVYSVPMDASLHDSVPLVGMTLNSTGSGIYLNTGSFLNDVVREYSSVSHIILKNRTRVEVISSNCSFNIGCLTIKPTGAYLKSIKYILYQGTWFPSSSITTLFLFSQSKRLIVEIEWIDSRNVILTVVVDNSYLLNRTTITLPEYDSPTQYTRFDKSGWNSIINLYGGTVSNFSVVYEKELLSQYVSKSWESLTTSYVPSFYPNLIELNDQVDRCKMVMSYPNSLTHQLDSLLIRGISQRVFNEISVSDNGDGTWEIGVILSKEEILTTNSEFLHDFSVGEKIYIDGLSQSFLNGTWEIDRIEVSAVYFTSNSSALSEQGYFIIKRSPIGGGSWSRTSQFEYSSSQSLLSSKMVIDDSQKTGAKISIKNNTGLLVWWKRYLKRPSTSYFGADLGQGRPQWTIIGDHKRFILVIAYKQNPKDHSHILLFGDYQDPKDNQWKTILEGYKDDQIGDVGFNFLFDYSKRKINSSGILTIEPDDFNQSNFDWLVSDQAGISVDTLHGTKDSGFHQYPIYIGEV